MRALRKMKEKREKGQLWKQAVEIFSRMSLWIVSPIILALIAGTWLDERYGTAPWIFLGAIGIGFLISCLGIAFTARTYVKKIEEEHESNSHK